MCANGSMDFKAGAGDSAKDKTEELGDPYMMQVEAIRVCVRQRMSLTYESGSHAFQKHSSLGALLVFTFVD